MFTFSPLVMTLLLYIRYTTNSEYIMVSMFVPAEFTADVMPQALNVWQTHCLNCACQTLFRNFNTDFLMFRNIFLKHLFLRFFLKRFIFYAGQEYLQRKYFLLKIQRCVLPWCRLNWRYSLNLKREKRKYFFCNKKVQNCFHIFRIFKTLISQTQKVLPLLIQTQDKMKE